MFLMGKFPFVREQLDQFLMCGLCHVRHPADDVVETRSWIDIMVAAGGQKGHDDAHVPGGFVVAAEQEVLPADGDRADLVLGGIIQTFG